jgi:hypothetical protein
MRGEAGNDGGGGDTQVLDGGTPPLGECALFIGRGSVGDRCNVKVLIFFGWMYIVVIRFSIE